MTAYAGEELKIDLGRQLDGELIAWMVRVDEYNTAYPNHREFDVLENRYLVMPKERMLNCFFKNCEAEQLISGEWYFDVEFKKTGSENSKTILTGILDITGDITSLPESFNVFEIFDREFNESFE